MSNEGISSRGVVLQGAGFIVSPGEAEALGIGAVEGLDRHILHYRNGRDLAQRPRGAMVIDLYPLQSEEVRELYPAVFQHVLTSVKPGRDQSRRAATQIIGGFSVRPERISETLPRSCPGSSRRSTPRNTDFSSSFDAAIVPDSALVNVGVTDAGVLSVLSSRLHVVWALSAAAGWVLEMILGTLRPGPLMPSPSPRSSRIKRERCGGSIWPNWANASMLCARIAWRSMSSSP